MSVKTESFSGNGATRTYRPKINNTKMHQTVSPKLGDGELRLGFLSNDAEEKITEVLKTITKIGKRYTKMSQDYLKQNPLKGIAIASTVGFLAGSMVTLFVRKRTK